MFNSGSYKGTRLCYIVKGTELLLNNCSENKITEENKDSGLIRT